LGAFNQVFFLRFRFGDRKEILRDRLEEFERPLSIDVISGHYILRDRWRNLRDRFGPLKHLKKTLLVTTSCNVMNLCTVTTHHECACTCFQVTLQRMHILGYRNKVCLNHRHST